MGEDYGNLQMNARFCDVKAIFKLHRRFLSDIVILSTNILLNIAFRRGILVATFHGRHLSSHTSAAFKIVVRKLSLEQFTQLGRRLIGSILL